MGMDLKPMRPSKLAPRYQDGYHKGKLIWGRYNWTGWHWLIGKLTTWGVSTEHLAVANDGDLIPAKKCREIADAIERNAPSLEPEYREWITGHIERWRTCGGYRQY